MTMHKKVERKHTIGVRLSDGEMKEITDLARETRLCPSALLRYAFSLARDRIAKTGNVAGETGGEQ